MRKLKFKDRPSICIIGVIIFFCLSLPLYAQAGPPEEAQLRLPDRGFSDENGINVVSATPSITIQDVTIGGERPLSNSFSSSMNCNDIGTCPHFRPDGYVPNQQGNFLPTYTGGLGRVRFDIDQGALVPFNFGSEGDLFKIGVKCPIGLSSEGLSSLVGREYESFERKGGKLKIISTSEALYISRNGDKYHISLSLSRSSPELQSNTPAKCGLYGFTLLFSQNHPVTKIEYASGLTLNINYTANLTVSGQSDITSVVRSDGYALKYIYSGGRLTKTIGLNTAVEDCALHDQICSNSQNWPEAQYEWSALGTSSNLLNDRDLTITHPTGEKEKLTMNFRHWVKKHELPAGQVREYTYCDIIISTARTENCSNFGGHLEGSGYTSLGKVASVKTNDNSNIHTYKEGQGALNFFVLFDYFKSVDGYHEEQENAILGIGNLLKAYGVSYSKRRDGTECFFEKTITNRLIECKIDGIITNYFYDNRSNVIRIENKPKGGGTILNSEAFFLSQCDASNQKICNKPISSKDANGNITTYTYDPAHGGVLKITGPADSNGIQPQTRYTYTQRRARNAKGVEQDPVWLVATLAYCIRTAATNNGCSGGALDEVVTTYDYGPLIGPNNLNVRGQAVASGGKTLLTCYKYDKYGRKISSTQPKGTGSTCP